ncbi:amine acid ABC transporter, permease protein, 3-TM region, His/Glu/Gln/Arg/opine family [Meinhardsimonia xiamenensis]|jgi:His/Glu/Gln/Arg/opine family amino acid ABC transporter permease subunit|uniref:Amine acid ABC transporter, permease protein, 3-TM region, His/Glu/Gln/Arg/opine family n=1 Tax=Meinhardsimonia xiamenensis TaxID=990712 RepID=A0A1G9EBE8_9RHOB|nr:amino acid ABC transporter permease [Meinhardsimonia xiamenensis]PRX33848.1 His/Glu/Gln/Arg/opine family amino acid ABC transporter permease subunit [Meinhardsimonia xiamenensis]SDK73407.1 amine acid ABC transporter, permease protein, 3-TM region, His/Glu/Gln/Arg/opine family [Meinhardsimonia xiamenensis]
MSETHAEAGLAYVRETMLPPLEPPLTETGAIKWIRENLLSSWLNVILTAASIFVIWFLLSHIIPWLWHTVWNAGSLNECREVRDALWGPDVPSACFAVIHERWNQFLFGFYPAELYWRPVLALVLFFVALAPVLFSEKVPGQLLVVTVVYPFVGPWLIWGGSFWFPGLIALGFVAAWLAWRLTSSRWGAIVGTLAAIAAAVVWWGVLTPLLDDGINRLVGGLKMEATEARLAEAVETLPQRISALEETRDALDIRIREAEERKAELIAQIVEARANGRVDALDTLRTELLAQMRLLTDLRLERQELSQRIGRLSAELSETSGLLSSIRSLPERLAALPELKRKERELRDALPPEAAALGRLVPIPPDLPAEAAEALKAWRAAADAVTTAEQSIQHTYAAVALTGLKPVTSREIGGFMLALIIGIAGIVLSLPLGILLALGRQSELLIINKSSVAFIETIRGVPLIVWLFTASLLLNYFLPPGTNFDLMLRVIIMVTLFAAAYIAEVVRGGLAALPRGQYEAAAALGLDYWKSMRLVILPQALKISIPGIVNTFIGLFKDTTLVVFIGLLDPIGLTNTVRADSAWNGIYWELFVFIGALFFIFCFGMGRYSIYLEKKLHTGH